MNQVFEVKDKRSKIRDKVINKKSSLQFLPISLEEISLKKKVDFLNSKLKSSYLIDIVHNLLLRYYFRKENVFHLSSTILKEKYGHNYNYYIRYLVDNQILILLKNHQKGKNSRIYKLNDSIITGEIKRYQNSDNILLKKYKNTISLVDGSSNYQNGIIPDVKKKIVEDLFSVKIDYSKSIFYLDSTLQDIDIYNKNKYSVECIKENHIFYHFDDYGRFHTNFTILKSFIRKNCLLIDGDETCEIDINNSQPLFLCRLINDHDVFIVDDVEFNFFKQLTINGNFYQYLIDNCEYSIDKKKAKEIVYRVFFGKNYKNKYDDFFKRLFPTIYSFIKSYKREMLDYRSLAYALQRAESNLIFNKIIKKIMDIYPEIKVVTVHDSIICSKKYKDVVEIVFNKILKDEFDFD